MAFLDSILLPQTVETGFARRIVPHIAYNGKDISEDLGKYLKSIEYTDELSGSADDLQLTLEDKQSLWLGDWFPEKGASLEAVLEAQYWKGPDDLPQTVQLGTFEIDEIECLSMPSEVKIKSVSVPNDTTLRGVDRNRSWEKATVKKIAEDIATEAKLELFYDTEENPTIDRAEQTEQSDLSFLEKLCSDNGFALKIADKKIVIFDVTKYEAAEPVFKLIRKEAETSPDMTTEAATLPAYVPASWSFSSSIREVYKSCRVTYQKSDDKEKISYTFDAPGKTTGKVLVINQQIESVAEAEKIAKKELRKKNAEEVKGSFTVMGELSFSAGFTVTVEGYGVFDGKYIITRVGHSIGSGYTCKLDIRRCLNGY